jgi:hypothetical protein
MLAALLVDCSAAGQAIVKQGGACIHDHWCSYLLAKVSGCKSLLQGAWLQ